MQGCTVPGAGEAQSSEGSLSKKCRSAAKENYPSAICSVVQNLHNFRLHYKRKEKWKKKIHVYVLQSEDYHTDMLSSSRFPGINE